MNAILRLSRAWESDFSIASSILSQCHRLFETHVEAVKLCMPVSELQTIEEVDELLQKPQTLVIGCQKASLLDSELF